MGETWAASWRDGIVLAETSIWCDAPRQRELCFVSSAPSIGRARHGQLVATAATLGILGATRPRRTPPPETELAVPLGRPFSLGSLRLELFASGHCLGGAQMIVDAPSRRIGYAGAVFPEGTMLSGPGDVRRCDALVIDATDAGDDRPSHASSMDALAEAAVSCGARGGALVVVCSDGVLALDVVAALTGRLARRLVAHRRFVEVARAARRLGHPVPMLGRAPTQLRPGMVAVLPAPPETSRLPRGSAVHAAPVPRADRRQLLDHIEQTQATEVVLTGRGDHRHVRDALRARGVKTTVLGPPEQLALELG